MSDLSPERLAELMAETADPRIIALEDELRRQARKIDKLKLRNESLARAMRQAVTDNLNLLRWSPVTRPAPQEPAGKGKPEVAVAMLADWQLGKKTPGYSTELCEERVELMAEKVKRLTNVQRADHPVDELHVWLLGDLVEGELIFPGQHHRIDASLYRQAIVDGPRILGNFLREMLSHFPKVKVTGVIGNHGAIGGRSRQDMHPESNADLFLYDIVRQSMKAAGEELEWDLPLVDGERMWFAVDRIGNYSSLLVHGDQFRGGNSFAGLPYYSFAKKALSWQAMNRTGDMPDFDDIACGHWHTHATVPVESIEVRVAGTTESYNTWSIETLARGGSPSQRMLFVRPDRGIVTAEYKVIL